MNFYLFFSIIVSAVISNCLCDDVAFIKIGTYSGIDKDQNWVTKTFHVPRYFEATWVNAALICNLYHMELARFDTTEEYESVRQMMIRSANYFTEWTHIGGMTTTLGSKTEWFWSQPSEKISYPMTWRTGEPNSYQNRQWCLALGTKSVKDFRFDDIDCFRYHEEKFLCQNVEAVSENY